jgi:hypothetical protein
MLAFYLVAAIAAYQCASALVVSSEHLSPHARAALAAGCLGLVALVALLPLGTGGWWAVYGHDHLADDAPNVEDSFPCADDDEDNEENGEDGRGCAAAGAAAPERAPLLAARHGHGEEREQHEQQQQQQQQLQHPPLPSLSTLQMTCTFEFWCIFLQFCVGSGAALALLNNMGQVVVALGAPPGAHVVLVSLFSVANAAGGRARAGAPWGDGHSSACTVTCVPGCRAVDAMSACPLDPCCLRKCML